MPITSVSQQVSQPKALDIMKKSRTRNDMIFLKNEDKKIKIYEYY